MGEVLMDLPHAGYWEGVRNRHRVQGSKVHCPTRFPVLLSYGHQLGPPWGFGWYDHPVLEPRVDLGPQVGFLVTAQGPHLCTHRTGVLLDADLHFPPEAPRV